MRKTVLTLVAMMVALSGLMAQTSLRGKVVSEDGARPIEGVKVTLAGQDISTMTNLQGEFVLIYLDAIDEEVIFEAEGYITDIQLVSLQENRSNDMGSVTLKTDI